LAKAVSISASLALKSFFPDRPGCRFGFSHIGHSRREIRVQEHCDGRGCGNEIAQQAQTLLGQFGGEDVDPGRIAAGSGEAGDELELDRIRADLEHDRDRCGRGLGRSGRSFAADRHDDGYLTANEISRQRRHLVVLGRGPSILDRSVAALDGGSWRRDARTAQPTLCRETRSPGSLPAARVQRAAATPPPSSAMKVAWGQQRALSAQTSQSNLEAR
jgi:hypothetical protein